MERIVTFMSLLWQSMLSFIKVVLLSRPAGRAVGRIPAERLTRGVVVLGNGPSLNETVERGGEFLASHDLLAVNFAACTPLFAQLKPDYYLLADPHFFKALDRENVAELWKGIAGVEWDMTLFVPVRAVMPKLPANPHLNIVRFNTTPVEGFAWVENLLFSARLGMPRPRNVLIPSIMAAIGMGYKHIYLAGADHSWTRTLSVDDDNNVVSVQPHFYKEDTREVKRINTEYMHYPLHKILYSFYVAFKSYFTIARYARYKKAEVINITPGSFIDAFQRQKV